MQLLLILALLLFGGRDDAGKLLKEFRPVLEQFGGDDVKQALKSAEELQGVISALGSFGAAGAGGANNGTNFGTTDGKNCSHTGGNQNRRADGGNTAENKNTRTYAANNGNSYGFDGENVKDGGTADYGRNYGCSEPDSSRASSGGKGDGAARSYAGDFPLAPVAGIADKEILYRLVRFFSEGVAAG